MSELEVVFIGTAGAVPTRGRGLTSTLVRRDGERMLFDCGEGTQRQLLRSVGLAELDAIFLTHFDADHWLGLPGLLRTYNLQDRERPLNLFGPPGLQRLLADTEVAFGRLNYQLNVYELEPFEEIQRDDYRIISFPVDHRVTAFGYTVAEYERPGRFDPVKAAELGIADGPDFGRLQRGESVNGVEPSQVMGENRAGRRVVISGDTRPCEMTLLAAQGAELLVHEATFLAEDIARARKTGHSTATEAAELARDADVGLLALNHLSAKVPPRELEREARITFADSFVARDFDYVTIPLPEQGQPELGTLRRPRPERGSAQAPTSGQRTVRTSRKRSRRR